MGISELIQKLIAESPGDVNYNPNSSGAIKTDLLQQEIEKNGIMFKKSVEYLAHCLKAYDIESVERKAHNMLEINLAIASIYRYKSRFFLLLSVEEVFNEFFQESEMNAETINIKDLNMEGIMRLSARGSSGATLKIKNGGAGSRSRRAITRRLSVRRNKKFSMIKFLLMLMSILNLVSAGGENEIIDESPVGLYMNTELATLARVKSEYTRVSVGFPYPTKGSDQEEVFRTGDQQKIAGPSTILKPEYGELTIPFTTIKLNNIENTVSNWASSASSALTPATSKEKLTNAMASIMTKEFNSISDKIQDKITTVCSKLVKDVQLNKIFSEKEISNLAKYKFTPGTSSTSYLGVTTTTASTEIHTFFTSSDLVNYMKKLCSVPELRLDPFQNDDGTYTVALTRFGLPHAEELLSNLTIATGEHLSRLIQKSEKAYEKEMAKKGIEKIETDYALITKDTIRRTFLLNLQEKISLYKILIDNIVSEQESLSEIFTKYNKGSSVSDITTPEDLQNFLDSIQAKNKDILKELESTLRSEEYTTETPFSFKELKNTETLVEAQIKTLEQMELLKQDNLEKQMRLIEERRRQQEIALNASRTEKLYEQTVNKDTMAGYMNTIFSYGEGFAAPIYDTAGKMLDTGSESMQSLLKGAGDLLGGGISSVLTGLCGGLFGSWGWLAGLTFFSAVPIMIGAYVSWKIGGVQLVFRLIGGSFKLTYAVVTYLPRKIFVTIFARRSNGNIVSQGTIIIPNAQNLIPGSPNLPMLGAPSPAIREVSSSEARRIERQEDIRQKLALARRRASAVEARLGIGSRPASVNIGGRRYRKRTFKRKHNKRNRRSRRK